MPRCGRYDLARSAGGQCALTVAEQAAVVIRIGHLRMRSLRPHMPGRVKPSLPSSTTDSSAAVSPPSVSRTGLANGPVPALPAATPAGTCAPAAPDGGSGGALRSAGFPAIPLTSLGPEVSHCA